MSDSDNERRWTEYGRNQGTIRIRYPSAVNLANRAQLPAEPEQIQPPHQTHQKNQQAQPQEEITLLQQKQIWEQQWQEIQQQYQVQQQNQNRQPQIQNLETRHFVVENSDYLSFSPVSPDIELESCCTCNEFGETMPLLSLLSRSASSQSIDRETKHEIRKSSFGLSDKRNPISSSNIEQYGSLFKFPNNNSQSQNADKNKSVEIASDARRGNENLYRQIQKNKAAKQSSISSENTSDMAAASFESCNADQTISTEWSSTDPFKPGNTIVANNNSNHNSQNQKNHKNDSEPLKRSRFDPLFKKLHSRFWRFFHRVKQQPSSDQS
jgi:hypothetical protein